MPSPTLQSGLQLYLRQINQSPLLSADQEKDLARRIIHDNDPEARERMVRSNLRLVVNIARHYVNRGLSFPDLIEEGNIGLLKAVEGFDPENGSRFSTYASWWIKQAIKRRNPGFNERAYGFRSFNDLLLEAQRRGLLKLDPDAKSGGYSVKAAE